MNDLYHASVFQDVCQVVIFPMENAAAAEQVTLSS